MKKTTTNCQILYKLTAINSAEHYMIARTHREIRAGDRFNERFLDVTTMILATSAACTGMAFVLVQVWRYIAASASI